MEDFKHNVGVELETVRAAVEAFAQRIIKFPDADVRNTQKFMIAPNFTPHDRGSDRSHEFMRKYSRHAAREAYDEAENRPFTGGELDPAPGFG